MAKATTTITQVLTSRPEQAAWFAANQVLSNRVCAFYFAIIHAHVKILDLSNKEALTALEKLTHTTKSHPAPIMPLEEVAENIPAMFRRAALNAALGSARSFFSHLQKWQKRKEKAEAKGMKFHERPPVPPRTWNKSAVLYAGMCKHRSEKSIVIKVWTGTCWSWIKVRITGRKLPPEASLGSPQLIGKGSQWWLHTPIEKQFKSPGKIEKQVTTNAQTKICAVDLNINEHIAVCTIQTVEGSILATKFIGGGRRLCGFRKKLLGRIAHNRKKTGLLAENEQDNATLWHKMRQVDEQVAHLISVRIVQFAQAYDATVLVFEHLGNLKPTQGKYSKRGRECAHCQSLVARYHANQPAEGSRYGAPLVYCAQCAMKGNADRNASLVIGQRLATRYQQKGKPQTPRREEKSSGVAICQDAQSGGTQPSTGDARHADTNEHGTAQERGMLMVEPVSDIAHQLRFPCEL